MTFVDKLPTLIILCILLNPPRPICPSYFHCSPHPPQHQSLYPPYPLIFLSPFIIFIIPLLMRMLLKMSKHVSP